jgi:hypothetical protein
MSNPIADTAEYFARWQRHEDESTPSDPPNLDTPNTEASLTDIRAQWHRVLNRLSFLTPPLTTEPQEFSDDESIIDRDTFELMRSRAASRHYSLNVSTSATGAVRGRDIDNQDDPTAVVIEDEGEEKLPDAYELSRDEAIVEQQQESNYFTHPFNHTEDEEPIQIPKPASTRSRRNYEGVPQEGAMRDKWDRTLDKLKLIANLQTTNTATQQQQTMLGPSHTLATYYPPAFDPLFSAFTQDEYGRKLVSHPPSVGKFFDLSIFF